MEDNRDKQLDDFIKKIVKSAGIETPSDGFTQNIMSKIVAQEEKITTIEYKPLISKTSWFVLAAFAVFLFTFIIFGNIDLNISWLPGIDQLAPNKVGFLDFLSQIHLPSTLVYGLSGLALFIYVQIFFLKKHLENRYTLS
ncbi:MAG: hypothetical protein WBN55_04105 [Eudoraea sp.]|uniref:hypothetical protein n=1 Tax=Eudoraea sp. TaxID=1979955 RepID=UPI003C77F250